MKKTLVVMVALFLVDMLAADLGRDELMSQVRELVAQEQVKHQLKLSESEADAAFQLSLTLNHITLDTFEPLARQSRKLVDALRAVAENQKTSDAAYREMTDFLSPQQWSYYSKNYTTEEQIRQLEEMIPDNMAVIVRTGQASFTPLVEAWLLQQYILASRRKADPAQMATPDEMVLKEWWRQRLQESFVMPADELEPLLAVLSMDSGLNEHSAEWKAFFKEKLVASLNAAADPQDQ